jgi:hypothetical protein
VLATNCRPLLSSRLTVEMKILGRGDIPATSGKKGPRSAILALVDDFAYAVVSAKTLKKITSTPDDPE